MRIQTLDLVGKMYKFLAESENRQAVIVEENAAKDEIQQEENPYVVSVENNEPVIEAENNPTS